MSQVTQSRTAYATSTTQFAYQSSPDTAGSSTAIPTVTEFGPFVHGKIKRSRNGKLPAHIATDREEQMNPSLAREMRVARASLSASMESRGIPPTLVQKRLALGFSQADLARKLGTSQSHIAKMESGAITVNFETAGKVADALQMSLDELRPLIAKKTPVSLSLT